MLGDSLVLTVLGQVSFMPILVLAARLCPEVCSPHLLTHCQLYQQRSPQHQPFLLLSKTFLLLRDQRIMRDKEVALHAKALPLTMICRRIIWYDLQTDFVLGISGSGGNPFCHADEHS